jgi:hypothetical protein
MLSVFAFDQGLRMNLYFYVPSPRGLFKKMGNPASTFGWALLIAGPDR